MKKYFTPTFITKLLFAFILFLFLISSEINAQGCAGGSICNWSGGPYRYPNGVTTPITLGCITTNGGGSNWVSYGPSWGGPGTPVLVFTAVAGQDYTFTLSGGQATGSNYLINIHSGNTPGAGVCVKTATARFGGPPWATSCTINVLAAELTAGNDYIVQFAECGETAGACVSVYRFGTTPDEFINISYGQTGVVAPAQPSTITPSTPICVGASQVYCVTNVVGVSYAWSVTAGGTITAGQGTNCVTINWTTTGVKTITVIPSSGGCNGTQRTRNITVNASPTVTSQPSNQAVCTGVNAIFTVATSAGSPTYQWQMSSDNATWFNVANGTPAGVTYSGATSATLTANGSSAVALYYYRCVISAGGCSSNSNSATLTINAYPIVNAIGGGAATVMVGNNTPAFTNSTPGGTWSITNGTGSATINGSGVATGTSAGSVTVNYSVTVNGCTTVVTTPLTVIALMPVELINFDVKCVDAKAVVRWTTASEINNDYFTIERSPDANTWNEIGTITGAGNSSVIHKYEFIDQSEIANTILYYKLKQTDFDGKYEYFGPISLELCSDDELQLVLQNIFEDEELQGTLLSKEDAEVTINIIDLQGRIVAQNIILCSKGSNLLQMDISSLDKGLYFIRAYNKDKKILSKFVKT